MAKIIVRRTKALWQVLECRLNASPFLAFLYITAWKNKYIWLRGMA